MRPFIQPTAGATFFLGISHTLMFRKDYVEIIFKLENGFYGVVNFVLNGKDDLLLLTDWGDFFKRISNHEDPDKLMRMLRKPCPLVVDLMTGKSGYSLVRSRGNNQLRVGCTVPVTADLPLLSLPGDSQTLDKPWTCWTTASASIMRFMTTVLSPAGRRGCRRCSEVS